MDKVAIPKQEYLRLKRQAAAYKKLAGLLFERVMRDPIEEVVEDFRKTDVYTDGFLHELGEGLKKSSYGKL